MPHISQMFDFSILRDLRKREGWTIEEVSRRSGVSPAVISKLERNRSQAELETLFKLSRVFGINATDLLGLAESRTAHAAKATEYRSGEFDFQRVRYANLAAYHGFARKGGKVRRPEIHRDDFEVCWVLSGQVRVQLPNELHELGPGQAIQFDAILEHSYEALEDCEIIIIHQTKKKRF